MIESIVGAVIVLTVGIPLIFLTVYGIFLVLGWIIAIPAIAVMYVGGCIVLALERLAERVSLSAKIVARRLIARHSGKQAADPTDVPPESGVLR
jgi:hypothetical protein